MKNKVFFILLMVFSMGMWECRKPPITTARPQNITEIDTFKVNEIDFKYLTAKAKINFKDSENDINATAHIRIRKDSIIWVSIVPALGIEASRCLIEKDSIKILDRINNLYHVYNFETLEKRINIHLTYHILQSMLLGSLPFPIQHQDQISKSVNKEYYILKQVVEGMQVENFIKCTSMKLEKFAIREEKTNKDLKVVYSNFLPLNNFFFPYNYQINIIYPMNNSMQSTAVSVEYNKVELPDKTLNFPFNIPNKYLKK